MGDEDAERRFEQLYRVHANAVFAYALARSTLELAKEAVEETFLVAWRRLDDIPAEPRPWLLGVARRVMARQWRARDRRKALELRIMAERASSHPGIDPAIEVVERDLTLMALNRLPSADRELLCLLAWGDLAPEEAARVLDCTVPAFRVRLHRARRRFEAALVEEGTASEAPPRVDELPVDPAFSSIRILVPKEQLQ